MTRIRPFQPGDEAALARICLLTADIGNDATGIIDDDDLWAELFVLPYVARHPDLAFVVEDDEGGIVGYTVGTPDTVEFEEWFREDWWPSRADRFRGGTSPRQRDLVRYADSRRGGAEPYGDDYPAHLHIDLLSAAQGQGWGRRLIEALLDALRSRGVTGVHLVASAKNTGAVAFYPRVGFAEIPAPEGDRVFVREL